ncbi:MAG: hypothetical protein A2015_01215 [Spirochaetes bacterium GWF1_31_7]|nr:MAG: hypothetical protein A2Y30_01115 [Spirochaetes bacterium GWE1_32_154]OHD47917.1 MAG: hypothetical protein A2015_01215 [Spirochaetes bacterium GWF1_31_7]OHD48909.1 MAG: hypothetical protein A2Y29_16930 [Spirochaetes bacterium GWE2_31_10]OHD72765.1 MAG: hypothetical protein A2355_06395 [Spirochaetes bacterium RIFOXYB1_FULL_32_8]HBD95456.1 hypothetical protein [Spirochaetia bacterium]
MRQDALHKWTQIMNTWKKSALSIADFCKEHNLDKSNFYQWRRRLESDEKEEFVKVIPVPPTTTAITAIIVHLPGNVKIEVTQATDLKLLHRIINSLGGAL